MGDSLYYTGPETKGEKLQRKALEQQRKKEVLEEQKFNRPKNLESVTVTSSEIQKNKDVLDVLDAQELLADDLLSANNSLEKLNPAIVDKKIIDYLENRYLRLAAEAEKLFSLPNGDPKAAAALRELQTLAIVRRHIKDEGVKAYKESPVNFTVADMKTDARAEAMEKELKRLQSEYSDKLEQAKSLPRWGLKKETKELATKRGNLLSEAQNAKERADELAGAMKDFYTKYKADVGDREKSRKEKVEEISANFGLKDIQELLGWTRGLNHFLEIPQTAQETIERYEQAGEEADKPTQKARLLAERTLDRLADVAEQPENESAEKELDAAYRSLENALNIKDIARKIRLALKKIVEEMENEMLQSQEAVKGIQALSGLSSASEEKKRSVEKLGVELNERIKETGAEYVRAKEDIAQIAEKLFTSEQTAGSSEKREQAEGLAAELQNSDVKNTFKGKFDEAKAKLDETINELRKEILKPKEQKTLEGKETRQLPEHKFEESAETDTLSAKTPEGREIKFNIQEQLKYWGDFYKTHNIDWIQMPDTINLSPDQIEKMTELMKQGFDKMIIIPDNLVPEPKTTGSPKTGGILTISNPRYAKLHQIMSRGYNITFTGSNYDQDGKFEGSQDKTTKLRILLTKDVQNIEDDPLFSGTIGKSIEDLEKDELTRYTGFSEASYLIYQKEFHERTKKHLDENGWTWLPESERLLSSRRAVEAGWEPNYDRLSFASRLRDYKDVPAAVLGCRLVGSFEVQIDGKKRITPTAIPEGGVPAWSKRARGFKKSKNFQVRRRR